MKGKPCVQVMLFRDRLEVWSPGQLPMGITLDKLLVTHRSIPVNPTLATPVYLAGYIERLGTGTTDIVEKCEAKGLRKPDFNFDGDFTVTIWRKNHDRVNDQVNVPINSDGTTKKLTERQKLIVRIIKIGQVHDQVNAPENDRVNDRINDRVNDRVNAITIAHYLNVSEPTIRRDFAELQKLGIIKRIGSDKTGHWEVIENVTPDVTP